MRSNGGRAMGAKVSVYERFVIDKLSNTMLVLEALAVQP